MSDEKPPARTIDEFQKRLMENNQADVRAVLGAIIEGRLEDVPLWYRCFKTSKELSSPPWQFTMFFGFVDEGTREEILALWIYRAGIVTQVDYALAQLEEQTKRKEPFEGNGMRLCGICGITLAMPNSAYCLGCKNKM